MEIITRHGAVENLKRYVGKDLNSVAIEYGITQVVNGKTNKGWKGLLLERAAGLTNNNSKAPNGLSYELKSVNCNYINRKLCAKETMAITMINQKELVATSFFDSHCWSKIKSLVLCAIITKNNVPTLFGIFNFDFVKDNSLILEIEKDYEFIRNKMITLGFSALTGADGKWIQARTKGAGHGSKTRAFYARRNLIDNMFKECGVIYV